MSDNLAVTATVDVIAAILADQGIRHAFGGALAQNYWGVVRATQDVDVLALIPALRFQQIIDVLTSAGFCARDEQRNPLPLTVARARDSLSDRGMFVIWLGLVKVELFTPILPLQDRILERAVPMTWGTRTIPVTTAEDLIVLKMMFHRPKDMDDIRAMITVRGQHLNRPYMLEQASKVLDTTHQAELRALLGSS